MCTVFYPKRYERELLSPVSGDIGLRSLCPSVHYHLDLRDGWTDLFETWYTNNLKHACFFIPLISLTLAHWLPFLLQMWQADKSSSLVDIHMKKAFIYSKTTDWRPSLYKKISVCNLSPPISQKLL